MQSNIVNALFGPYTTIIKDKCTANPPKIIKSSNGSSEECGFTQIVKSNTNLSILHKSQNPNYIPLYEAHKKDPSDWRFTDFDRSEGDLYLSGFRIDVKIASQLYDETKSSKGLPSWVAGAIPLTSLVDFPKGDGRSLYLCAAYDWSRIFVVSADDALEYVNEHLKYSQILTALKEMRAAGQKMETKKFDDKNIFITVNQLPVTAYEEIF